MINEDLIIDDPKIVEDDPTNEDPKDGENDPPEEVDVLIEGEEEAPKEDSTVIKSMRRNLRDKEKRIRELEKNQAAKEQLAELGKEPDLEDFDFDKEKFKKSYSAWHDRKKAHDAEKTQAEQSRKDQDVAWQNQLETHREKSSALKVSDFEDVSAVAEGTLTMVQQGIIVQGSENSALVMYALGKNPKILEDLSKIKDVAKFAIAVGRLESKLKVKTKSTTVKPETIPKGTGKTAGSSDAHLEKLRTQAEKTNDYSKVTAYKRQMRSQ